MSAQDLPEWFAAWIAYAQAAWRDCHLIDDERAAALYCKTLAGEDMSDLCAAVDRLMTTDDRFPTAARFLATARAIADRRRLLERHVPPRIAAPAKPEAPFHADRIPVDQRLEAFDDQAEKTRAKFRREAVTMAERSGWSSERLVERLAQDEAVGPFEARARELVAGGVSPGEGIQEFIGSFDGYGREREPRPVVITDEQRIKAFCDAWERGEKPDPKALPPKVLLAARAEWQRRHPEEHKVAS